MRNVKIPEIPAYSLPGEIIEDIMLSLPVKSLLRFRCVSKSWCSFISSKHFAKTHLQNQKQNLADQSLILASLIPSAFPYYTFNHCSVDSLFSQNSTDHRVHEFYRAEAELNYPLVVGCCNGLCCFYLPAPRRVFVLWNPSTGKSRELPGMYGPPIACGFGFVESDDDYRVVAMSYNFSDGSSRNLHIYSLKTNSWNKSPKRQCALETTDYVQGALVNGKLHWSHGHCSEITSFDLEKECVGIVSQPSCGECFGTVSERPSCGPCTGGMFARVRVSELEGRLCARYDYDHYELKIAWLDVWIMKEYGVKESWCKVFTFPYSHDSVLFPLCTSLVGDILCHSFQPHSDDDNLCIYYPKTCSSRSLGLNFIGQRWPCIGRYSRSLISPFFYEETEDNQNGS